MTEALLERVDARAAAQARSQSVVQRSDRPSQCRSAQDNVPRAGGFAPRGAKTVMELRDKGEEATTAHFVGMASSYESAYEMYDFFGPYTEIVSAGAGETTLARADLNVPLVLQHQSLRRIASTKNGSLSLSETDEGLMVDAPELDLRDHDVAYIAPKIRSGLIEEMSFMFRIVRGQWSPDYTEYRIQEYDIHRGDVAIVGFGANPNTSSELRAVEPAINARHIIRLDDVTLLPRRY